MTKKNIVERYGRDSWAVVTGGSDGIGLGIAEEFAAEGLNVVLIAKDGPKLESKKAEILKKYPTIKCEVYVCNFKEGTTVKFYQDIYDALKQYDVSVLVNNVGIGRLSLGEDTAEGVLEMAVVNMLPQTMLTKMWIDDFKKRTSRSAVIDIASVASWEEYIGTTLYGPTKRFNRALSQCLNEKYGSEYGIDFLCVKPGYVLTNIGDGRTTVKELFKNKPDGKMCFTVKECAVEVINSLGNMTEVFGCHRNWTSFGGVIWASPYTEIKQVGRFLGLVN